MTTKSTLDGYVKKDLAQITAQAASGDKAGARKALDALKGKAQTVLLQTKLYTGMMAKSGDLAKIPDTASRDLEAILKLKGKDKEALPKIRALASRVLKNEASVTSLRAPVEKIKLHHSLETAFQEFDAAVEAVETALEEPLREEGPAPVAAAPAAQQPKPSYGLLRGFRDKAYSVVTNLAQGARAMNPRRVATEYGIPLVLAGASHLTEHPEMLATYIALDTLIKVLRRPARPAQQPAPAAPRQNSGPASGAAPAPQAQPSTGSTTNQSSSASARRRAFAPRTRPAATSQSTPSAASEQVSPSSVTAPQEQPPVASTTNRSSSASARTNAFAPRTRPAAANASGSTPSAVQASPSSVTPPEDASLSATTAAAPAQPEDAVEQLQVSPAATTVADTVAQPHLSAEPAVDMPAVAISAAPLPSAHPSAQPQDISAAPAAAVPVFAQPVPVEDLPVAIAASAEPLPIALPQDFSAAPAAAVPVFAQPVPVEDLPVAIAASSEPLPNAQPQDFSAAPVATAPVFAQPVDEALPLPDDLAAQPDSPKPVVIADAAPEPQAEAGALPKLGGSFTRPGIKGRKTTKPSHLTFSVDPTTKKKVAAPVSVASAPVALVAHPLSATVPASAARPKPSGPNMGFGLSLAAAAAAKAQAMQGPAVSSSSAKLSAFSVPNSLPYAKPKPPEAPDHKQASFAKASALSFPVPAQAALPYAVTAGTLNQFEMENGKLACTFITGYMMIAMLEKARVESDDLDVALLSGIYAYTTAVEAYSKKWKEDLGDAYQGLGLEKPGFGWSEARDAAPDLSGNLQLVEGHSVRANVPTVYGTLSEDDFSAIFKPMLALADKDPGKLIVAAVTIGTEVGIAETFPVGIRKLGADYEFQFGNSHGTDAHGPGKIQLNKFLPKRLNMHTNQFRHYAGQRLAAVSRGETTVKVTVAINQLKS